MAQISQSCFQVTEHKRQIREKVAGSAPGTVVVQVPEDSESDCWSG